MKTRTSQNGVAGIMSRLIHNIKSAALALAALALAAPSAWGAETPYTWKDGASGNTNDKTKWEEGTAPTSGVSKPTFNNTGTALSTVNNNITMSNSTRFSDGTVKNGVFSFTGNWYFKTFSMADTENSQATVTKTGTWTCNNGGGSTYQFRYGIGKNSKASFTNVSGDIGDIATGRATRDMDFTVGHGEGSDAEFILKAGTVTSSTALVLGYGTSSKGLLVMDGGAMNCKTTNVVARGTGSTGIARINSGTFTGNSKPFYVAKGANSTGTVVVNGGTLNTADFLLGDANGANASVIVSNGTVSASGHTHIGYKSGGVTTNYFEVAGGDFSQTAANMHLYIGSEGATGTKAEVCAKGNGKMNISRSIILGNKVGGTLTVKDNAQVTLGTKTADGHVNMCYASAYNGDPSYLNLDGGTLTTKMVTYGSGTSGNAFVTFNGGTLKANQATTTFIADKPRLFAKVGAKGGTIDSAGFAITIPKAIESGVSGETDGGMTFKGGGTVTLTGANTYTGVTVIDAGTTIQMPAANNLAGNIVVTNATFADCPITVLTLTNENAVVDAALLARCSLAADAPDTVELTVDGASVMVTVKAGQPTTARLIYDSGTDSWNWEFRDVTDAVVPSVNQSALEAGSVTVIFGSTAELAAIGTVPAWVGGWQMASTFAFNPSASASLPAEYTFDAGTLIDLKGCNWTLPDGLKSATVDFTVTNSVDATKAVLTVDVASGATFTETHLTLGGNLELRKTGAGTYAMTKDQQHTGGSVVTAGTMTRAGTVTVGVVAGSSQSLSVEGGSFTMSDNGSLVVGANGVGEFTITNATATVNNIQVGNGTGAGTMNINGGTVTVSGWSYLATSDTSGGAVLNLNGGTLATRRINVGTTADSLILFNGGTLYINGVTTAGFTLGTSNGVTPEHLTIAVGENGGTIKTTNNDDKVKVCAGIVKADGVETDGGLEIVGGGKLTVTGSLSYTGGTTVEIGTTLVITDTSLGGGLSATIPETQPAAGTTNILVTTTGEGVFTDSDLPDVTAFPYYRAMLSEDAKSILVVRVAPAMSVTGFNLETGEITLGFENMDGALDLVVAWDAADHGAALTSWPSGKSIILGTVAAGTTTATFTLPDEVQTVGTYYRLFLGDSATKPYDEEVAWIQPTALGAYIKTDYKPTAGSWMAAKVNLNSQTYSAEPDLYQASGNYRLGISTAGTSFHVYMPNMGNASFGTYSASSVLNISMHYVKSGSNVFFVNGSGNASGVFNWAGNYSVTDSANPLYIFSNYGGTGRYSRPILYSMSWTNSANKVAADFIPVKNGGEYGLYDKVGKKVYLNAGAEGTSFKGGAKTANGPVTFADGQMTASDTQQYLGATVIDQENCSITMDGATATINWALTQPGGASADIVAVFTTGSSTVTNVLATGVATASNGVATVENVYATGQITITLFARSGDNKSVNVSQTFPATTMASVPSTPVLSVDETLHQIAATGMVTLGTGTTVAWLDYGATTSYGKKIDLTLDEGAWSATIPYDDALWKAGKVYVRVTAANEIAGIFGTSKSQKTATANASFTAGVRTLAQTAFDSASGTATFAFGGDAAAAQDLVVAWGDRDYGENIASWPYNKRAVIGSVAADAITGTYTLPAEARVSGTYYRFFLGDRAVAPYDEEVEWIQPDTSKSLGAYIQTSFRPSQKPQSETKLNLDNQSYGSTWATLYDAGTGWANGVWVYANQSGRIGARRAGYADFGPFSKTADLTVGLVPNGNYYAITVNGTTYTHNNFNQTVSMTPERDLSFWRFVDNDYGYSKYRLYWSKWWNASKNKLEAHFIPVKKDGAYGLYDIVNGKVSMNSGAEGTSFVGGNKTGYSPVTFATVQTAVTPVRMMGTIELASRDWERPQEHVTLNWTAPGAAATLWVVYSNAPMTSAPGEFADPSAWSFCTNIAASVAADDTTGTYTLCDPLADGNRYKSMRFVLATSGSTEANLVPLVVSEPYRTLKQATTIYIR